MNVKSLYSWRGCLGIVIALVVFCAIAGGIISCNDDNYNQKFEKAIDEGNISEAKALAKQHRLKSSAYLQLIKAYLDAGDADEAIDVYENITIDHDDRTAISPGNGTYSAEASKMLREYLMKHGQYDKAWDYYPLAFSDENRSGNAQSRYAWLSDVVSEMCKKGQQEDARSFVDDQVRWFVTYVDGETDDGSEKLKANYGSEVVRQKLYNQIGNVHE